MKKTTILSQKQENYLLVILNMVNILNKGENSKKYINLKRNCLYRPSFTILASYGSGGCPLHPFEDRFMSVAELKDICSFPQSFKLTGSYKDRCERLGRSVTT